MEMCTRSQSVLNRLLLLCSVSGPNTENEWAREGRRIIPLLRRATPITAFTARADLVKQEVGREQIDLLQYLNVYSL